MVTKAQLTRAAKAVEAARAKVAKAEEKRDTLMIEANTQEPKLVQREIAEATGLSFIRVRKIISASRKA